MTDTDYKLEENELRAKRTKIVCIVSLILIPSGSLLDFLTYPDQFQQFGLYRIIVTIAVGLLFFLLRTEAGKRNVKPIGIAIALLINSFLCLMIYKTDGALSPYVFALNLIILGAGIAMIWTLGETIFVSLTSLAIYFFACSLNNFESNEDWNLLLMHSVFLLMATAIASLQSHFSTISRKNEYGLRSELKTQNQKLTELDNLKSQFFANVSHELRTPLTLILAPLQDLLQKPESLSEVNATLLRTARDNSLRLLKLVNDLLEVIKLEEGKSDLNYQTIDLNSFLGSVIESMKHLAEPNNIELNKALDPVPLYIRADSYALERIALNLLSNAIKFTPSGGSITVKTDRSDKNARIIIADTGIGIEQKDLEKIFDRFQQADSSNTRKYQGSGLGLALVRDLTEKMYGSVQVESEYGKGTVMTVALPLQESSESTDVVTASSKPPNRLEAMHQSAEHRAALPLKSPFQEFESQFPAGNGPTLLIVDDEPDMREYLTSILENDYRVAKVRDGNRALEIARENQPDLMLLDLMMPELDGHEVCRRLKNDPLTRKIKIVLLTARIDEAAKITALENGADDFLTKPFSRIEIETRLRNLLDTSRLETQLVVRNNELSTTISQLKEAQAQLVQSEKLNALGSLAAGLLHEVNNPLNYVMAAIQMAKIEPEIGASEYLTEYFEDITEGVDRIKNIVSDLHTFAHPSESDKRKSFSIKTAVTSAIRFTSHDSTNIEMATELVPEDIVFGSQSHVIQVLVNLFSNAIRAIKATEDGRKGRIRISTEISDNRLRLAVTDNGGGMKEETLKRVFEPFFTTQDVGKGMGLGLSICHTIIRNHGGNLEVISTLGEGTEFSFELPRSEPQEDDGDDNQTIYLTDPR